MEHANHPILFRVPERASIHDKSYYTTNKDHLFRALLDISIHVQAHTQAELAHASSTYLPVGESPLVLITAHKYLMRVFFPSHGSVQGPLRNFQCLMHPGALEAGKPSTSTLFENL
jgi:hypothetical protein